MTVSLCISYVTSSSLLKRSHNDNYNDTPLLIYVSIFVLLLSFFSRLVIIIEMKPTDQLLQPRLEEDTESFIDDEDGDAANTVACYYLNGSDGVDGAEDTEDGENKQRHSTGVSFDSRLGLAVETVQPGVTMDQLWRVI